VTMTEFDYTTPCPGCGNVGFSIDIYEHVGETEVHLMRCSQNKGTCRVCNYYPEIVEKDND